MYMINSTIIFDEIIIKNSSNKNISGLEVLND